MENYFSELNKINVNDKTEQKNGLTYLSWAWAWGEVKKRHPDACYTIYENRDGWCYHTDGTTCWVKTGVTVAGIEHIEYLPVMDHKNRSIPLASVTSFDVNKAIQRSLTKAVARHGLGLHLYAGEDLPEEEKPDKRPDPPREDPGAPIDQVHLITIRSLLKQADRTEEAMLDYCRDQLGWKVSRLEELTMDQGARMLHILRKKS